MPRKRILKEDKRCKLSITLNDKLYDLLENDKEHRNKSKFIEILLEEYFSKKNQNDNETDPSI